MIRCHGVLNGAACEAQRDAAGRPLRAQYSDGTPLVIHAYEAGAMVGVTNSAAVVSYK